MKADAELKQGGKEVVEEGQQGEVESKNNQNKVYMKMPS